MTFEFVTSVLEIRTVCTLTREQLYEVLLDWSYGRMSCGSVIGSLAMQRVETKKDTRQTSLYSSNLFLRRLGDFDVHDNAMLNL